MIELNSENMVELSLDYVPEHIEKKVEEKKKVLSASQMQANRTTENIYEAIIAYFKENGYSPTYRELCEMTGCKSTRTIRLHLNRLIEEGRIQVGNFHEPRTIRLVRYSLKPDY